MLQSGAEDDPRGRTVEGENSGFRGVLIRVMAIQVSTLLLLWFLQERYSR
jgi:hypothetical protein